MNLITYTRKQIDELINFRPHETLLGERIQCLEQDSDWQPALAASKARYVLLGLPEDVGIKANRGLPGARSAWDPFLKYFLNQQSNAFLDGETILALGHIDFSDVLKEADHINMVTSFGTDRLRELTAEIDKAVTDTILQIVLSGKIPLIIGGGHNNAFGAIKGSAEGLFRRDKIPEPAVNCINLDAHTDLRPLEGRHSGNAFSYALDEGCLKKYFVIGLQENHLQENVRKRLEEDGNLSCVLFEDIEVRENYHFREALDKAITFVNYDPCGLELDLDSIRDIPCSAQTPTGFSTNKARQYISYIAQKANVCYLHICEGAPSLAAQPVRDHTAKLIASLASDFVKSMENKASALTARSGGI